MIRRISLLGMELNDDSFPTGMKIIESFLADTVLSVVLSVDMRRLLAAGEDPVVAEVIRTADYTVVTDPDLLKAADAAGPVRRSGVRRDAFLTGFLNHMYRADRTFYLAASSGADLEQMRSALTQAFSYIRIVGASVISDDPAEYEACVNAVNIMVPDVILSSLDTPAEEYFLQQCRSRLCARIWYGAGHEPMHTDESARAGNLLRRLRNKATLHMRLNQK